MNNNYYISISKENTQEFVKIDGQKITIPKFEDFDFFIHKTLDEHKEKGDKWRVSCGETGCMIMKGDTKKEVIEKTENFFKERRCDDIRSLIEFIVKTNGKSPRYNRNV